ncbi:polysaccharide deacetylase family protein [Simiduia agarivorans]|uniref:Polysaccharide deacetylase n=1 Tax=Simiduia agarivorans (strain DSM 21679 / JCM 13881 / BCRC 17597 / SA1) TaxID=1117647 RepID=K4KN96_SIMAS|nr:polysaccharide deacetylase family protein [Simiduia agarivorans]AFV00517.1 polysaccharide deacetylase [Simiduia agarivorans SA1 = DSM 21679]
MKYAVSAVFVLALMVPGMFWLSKQADIQLLGGLFYRLETQEKVVALTFDDGPTPGKTEHILTILDAHDVSATFYLVGEAMTRHPEYARLIVQAGHELGNHSYTHARMMFKSYDWIADEIERTDQLIRDAGYEGEITFRPPYGRKFLMLPLYLKRRQIQTVTWDVEPDSELPLDASPGALSQFAIEQVKPGSVILMHVMFDSRANSMAAIEPMIVGLKAKGYRFVTVAELLAMRGE